MRVLGVVLLVLGVLTGAGSVAAGCLWGAAHVALAEPPSPMFQLPPTRQGAPSEGDTPEFTHAGTYVVDVWGHGRHGCRLDVSVPSQPVRHATQAVSEGPICMVTADARAGERWHIRAEILGDGEAYVSLRPPWDGVSFRWMWPFVGAALVLALGGAAILARERMRAAALLTR